MLEVGQRCSCCRYDDDARCIEARQMLAELRRLDGEVQGRAKRHNTRLLLEAYVRCPTFQRKRRAPSCDTSAGASLTR